METEEKKSEKLTPLLKNEKIKNEQNEKKVKFINNEGEENKNDKKKSFQNQIQIKGKRHNSVINPTINFQKKFFFTNDNIVELIELKEIIIF